MLKIETLSSGSKGNCYILSNSNTTIMLEAGIPWKEIQRKSGFRKIDACFISHIHSDHSKSVKDVMKLGIGVYMPTDMLIKIGRNHNVVGLNNLSHVVGCGWYAQAFSLQHDVASLGYCIDIDKSRVVYITDTMYCKYKIPNVTHWMVECNYSKDILDANVASGKVDAGLRNRIVQSHMSIETVKDMLRANDLSKCEAIYLMHLSDANSDEERFKREIQMLTGKIVYVC